MQVTFQRMAENDRFVVGVFVEQCLKIAHASGEIFNRKRHVFNDNGGADFAHGAHGREHAFANAPQRRHHTAVGGKGHGFENVKIAQRAHDRVALRIQRSLIAGVGFNQQRGCFEIQSGDKRRHAFFIGHRAHCAAIHHFNRRDRRFRQRSHGLAGLFDIGKHQQRRRFVRVFNDRVVGDFGDKAECAF